MKMGNYTKIGESQYDYTELDEIQDGNTTRGATLVWRNVNVYTKDKKNARAKNNLKPIINNSSGFIQPGTLMAVMGSRFVSLGKFVFHFL